MGIVAAFDKVLFFNAASKYSVLRLKTADIMIPQEARSPFTYRDHLIRFVAVGYDLDCLQRQVYQRGKQQSLLWP